MSFEYLQPLQDYLHTPNYLAQSLGNVIKRWQDVEDRDFNAKERRELQDTELDAAMDRLNTDLDARSFENFFEQEFRRQQNEVDLEFRKREGQLNRDHNMEVADFNAAETERREFGKIQAEKQARIADRQTTLASAVAQELALQEDSENLLGMIQQQNQQNPAIAQNAALATINSPEIFASLGSVSDKKKSVMLGAINQIRKTPGEMHQILLELQANDHGDVALALGNAWAAKTVSMQEAPSELSLSIAQKLSDISERRSLLNEKVSKYDLKHDLDAALQAQIGAESEPTGEDLLRGGGNSVSLFSTQSQLNDMAPSSNPPLPGGGDKPAPPETDDGGRDEYGARILPETPKQDELETLVRKYGRDVSEAKNQIGATIHRLQRQSDAAYEVTTKGVRIPDVPMAPGMPAPGEDSFRPANSKERERARERNKKYQAQLKKLHDDLNQIEQLEEEMRAMEPEVPAPQTSGMSPLLATQLSQFLAGRIPGGNLGAPKPTMDPATLDFIMQRVKGGQGGQAPYGPTPTPVRINPPRPPIDPMLLGVGNPEDVARNLRLPTSPQWYQQYAEKARR